MTVIAVRGRTMAADKMTSCGGLEITTTKIARLGDGSIVGGFGNSSRSSAIQQWYVAGADPAKYPDTDGKAGLLVLRSDGKILLFDDGPFPDLVEDEYFAVGSGRDFAIGAMHMGADVQQAVEIAIAHCNSCGRGIDALTLYPCSASASP